MNHFYVIHVAPGHCDTGEILFESDNEDVALEIMDHYRRKDRVDASRYICTTRPGYHDKEIAEARANSHYTI